jgi:hypothetical protein
MAAGRPPRDVPSFVVASPLLARTGIVAPMVVSGGGWAVLLLARSADVAMVGIAGVGLLGTLAIAAASARLDVGRDGIQRTWLFGRRFVPWSDVEGISVARPALAFRDGGDEAMVVRLRSGAVLRFRRLGARDPAVDEQLNAAMLGGLERGRSGAAGDVALPGSSGASAETLIDRVREAWAGTATTLRTNAMTLSTLMAQVGSDRVPLDVRAATAIALRDALQDEDLDALRTLARQLACDEGRGVMLAVADRESRPELVRRLTALQAVVRCGGGTTRTSRSGP